MIFKRLAIVTACLVVLFAFLPACAGGNGNLRISVENTEGSPIVGAKVVSESQPAGQLKIDGITTEEKGGVVFNEIKAGKYQIQVSRYGYPGNR